MAREAQELGALAISAHAPAYFKPSRVEMLVQCCAQMAGAAPDLPFYFYDIPALTGVTLFMPEFLKQARESIPNLAGIKYTNPDLVALQECLHLAREELDILWGTDECLLAALALGVKGAVGSTYNFAAPLAQAMMRSFREADWSGARDAQLKVVQSIRLLAARGYLAASKALMKMLGVNLGPVRLPLERLTPPEEAHLRRELESLGFFEWIAATGVSAHAR
jgi:N-acetylneuraminate lyase